MKFQELSPEIQEQIRVQQMLQEMSMYGIETIELDTVEGKKDVIDDGFTPYGTQRIIDRFDKIKNETWVKGEKYPMRGDFPAERTNTVTRIKKLVPVILDSFSGNIFRKVIAFLYIQKNIDNYVNFIWSGLRDVYMKPKYYTESTRAIYKALSYKNIDKIRDIVCAVWEYDTGYRYLGQDGLSELNKTEFEKNPIKEIKRLTNVFFERDVNGNMKAKFKKGIPLALLYLRFNKKLQKLLKDIVREIFIEDIKLSKEDIYWTNCDYYPHYNFRGLDFKTRQEEYFKEKNG